MKIGVLTHHWVPNFGANLQAYAVVKAFEDRGHDVFIINFRPASLEQLYSRTVSDVQRAVHKDFCAEHFKETVLVRDQTEFEALAKEEAFDFIISGSDAVFRLAPHTGRADYVFPNPYWLVVGEGFEHVPRRATLSVSSMGDYFRNLPAETKGGIRKAIASLDYVSTRDDWTIGELRKCGVEGQVIKTPDPVFYLREMIEEMAKSINRDSPYIAVSSGNWFGEKWMQEFKNIANKNGYRVLALPTPEGKYDSPVDERVPLPLTPFGWMKLIAESSGYLGARYHPVVVALLSKVPIVSTDKYHFSFWDRDRSKNYDLMKEFGAQRYCIGKLRKRILSPKKAFELFKEQESELGIVREKAELWTDELNRVVDRILQL